MTREELTLYNVGVNLDNLMNLDPRGYGVCRILYDGARRFTGEPLSTHAAKGLIKNVKKGGIVYILTGFVLLPWKKAEMDGIVSSMLLARFLINAFDAKPVVIVPEENMKAVRDMTALMGLHLYDTIEEMLEYPFSLCAVSFTKNDDEAEAQSESLMKSGMPCAVITNEAPGRNKFGAYHNATGLNTTEIEAKYDVLFKKLQKAGVYNLSIGDLGNEIGMGAIAEHIEKFIPRAHDNGCQCGCGGGILVDSKADNIITATVSDWGCNALMAACAYILKKPELFHDMDVQSAAMETAAKAGMLDMYGLMIASIDGFGKSINLPMVALMKELIKYPSSVEDKTEAWFTKTIEKGFFENE